MIETGRIIKIVSSRYEVLTAEHERVLCVASCVRHTLRLLGI